MDVEPVRCYERGRIWNYPRRYGLSLRFALALSLAPSRRLPMNALLIYPEFPDTFWSFKHALRFLGKRAAQPPLGLMTVAALLPGAGRSGWWIRTWSGCATAT